MPEQPLRRGARQRLLSTLLAIGSLLSVGGCHQVTSIDPSYPSAPVTHDEWTDFFVFGIVGDEAFDSGDYCSGDAATVVTGANVGTAIVGVLTLGIYTPRKVYISCDPASGTAAEEQGQ